MGSALDGISFVAFVHPTLPRRWGTPVESQKDRWCSKGDLDSGHIPKWLWGEMPSTPERFLVAMYGPPDWEGQGVFEVKHFAVVIAERTDPNGVINSMREATTPVNGMFQVKPAEFGRFERAG